MQSPYQYDSFASQLVEVYVNFNRSHLTISKRHLVTPWHRRSMIIFLQSQSTVFLPSADFPNCPKSSVSHLFWSHSTVSCRCMPITISNQIGNHANQYPACNYQNSVQFSDRGLSQRQVSRIIGALLGAISKVLCRFRETNSRPQWHRLKAVTDGRVRFCIVKGDLILSLSGSWPGELEAVFFRTVQRR